MKYMDKEQIKRLISDLLIIRNSLEDDIRKVNLDIKTLEKKLEEE